MGREVSGRRLVAEVPFEGRAEDERTGLMERSGAAGRAQGFITIHLTSQNRKQMFGMHLLRHARAKIICAWVPSFWAGCRIICLGSPKTAREPTGAELYARLQWIVGDGE